jgi:hypothetical protein
VHDRQRRRADAQAARLRSVALVNQVADSLPPGHELRRSFLEHAADSPDKLESLTERPLN